MKKMLKVLLMPLFLSSAQVYADGTPVLSGLDEKADQLCSKIERCAWQKLDADALSVQVQQELKAGLQQICQSVKQDVMPVQQQGLQYQATACIDSMLEQSCDSLINNSEQTPACAELGSVAAAKN